MLANLPGFVGSAFSPQSKHVDLQELHELYLEISESPHAKVPTGLLPTPGLPTFCVLPTIPTRGGVAVDDRTFAVGGDILYELSRTGVITVRPMTVLTTPGTPTISQSPLAAPLANPGVPVITQGGNLGTTAYSYRVSALNDLGETAASVTGSTATGNADLNPTDYNIITWERITGATSYKVYRTAPGASILLATVRGNTLFVLDIGTAGVPAAPPEENHSGGVLGATTYGYKVVARLGLGHTIASAEGSTALGHAILTAIDWNIITWLAVPLADSYDVYRTTGGVTPPVLIGNTKLLTFADTGMLGEVATPPTNNTTATDVLTNDGVPVSWATSGDAGQQVLIGAGGAAFCFDLVTNRLAKVVDGCTQVGYIGGYFVILDAATSTLKVSQLLDGFTWDDSQIYQRLNAGDRWLAMGVTSNEIWLFGTASADVWQGTGNDETRFAPYNSISIDEGIIAPKSLNLFAGSSFIWLGQSTKGAGVIWKSQGYEAQQISTRGIERAIERYTSISDAVGWSYQQEGHHFYVLLFPRDRATWVFDGITGEWHSRGRWDPDLKMYTAYRPWWHAFAFGGVGFGKHLVGDRKTGIIAYLDLDSSLDIEGSPLRRIRQSPHAAKNQQPFTISTLVIDLEPGNGTATGQGTNPMVSLWISKDGGKTWGKELRRRAGKQGDYLHRVVFNRLGDARDWVFRMVVSDPIAWRIARALWE
jgi:hypothetical protein